MNGAHQVTSEADRVTGGRRFADSPRAQAAPPGAVRSETVLQATFRRRHRRGQRPLAAVDRRGERVIADPELDGLLDGAPGNDRVGWLAVRLAAALGTGPAITVEPVRRGGEFTGALVGLARVADGDPAPPPVSRVAGLHAGHILLLAPAEIRVAEADGPNVWLCTERGRLRCADRGLNRLETRLNGFGFFRVHRHYLVNLRRVREIAPTFHGGIVLVLDGPDRPIVPVARRRAAEVRARLYLGP